MTILENEFLKVAVSSEGAELHSIFNKKNQAEYLWQADPEVWPWHAPNLFPCVGGSLNNEIIVDGKKYPMPKHGFARDHHFRKLDATPTHAKFALHSSEETLKVYPFKFQFEILYDLFDNRLRISYKVINLDKGTIWFALGGHAAFSVPFGESGALEDHYLEFELPDTLSTHQLSANGFFSGVTEPVALDDKKLWLTKDLFSKDALVFKDLASREITLKSRRSEGGVKVSFPHFNYVGIWAKPGSNFVCIEPWYGCADTEGKAVEFKNKEGVQCVEHGHVFETEYWIDIN